MAGRKQHYIPQSLQRGFRAGRSGLKTQVYVYRRGGNSYLTSTEGAGAERDFYSNPLQDGAGALDDRITDFESEHLTPILAYHRAIEEGEADSELASVMIAHLTARTAHLRGTMTSVVGTAFHQMKSIVAEPDSVRRFAGIDSTEPNSHIAKLMRESLSELGLDSWPEKERRAIERIVTFRVRERFDVLFAQAQDTLQNGLTDIGERVPESMAKGHARALSDSLVSQVRVQALRKLSWRIVPKDLRERHFVLPDCVAIGCSFQSKEFSPLSMLGSDEISIVVMPISAHQLLIGSCATQPIDQDDINLQLAKCSLEFFISSQQGDDMNNIAKSIGEFAEGLNFEMFEDAPTPNEELPNSRGARKHLKIRAPEGKRGQARKRVVIEKIIWDTFDATTLDMIESVIIPVNMSTALSAILKRPPSATELQAASLGLAEPIRSGDSWKCRIIFPHNIAEATVEDKNQLHRVIATRLLKVNVGRAYYICCWARQFPGIFEHREAFLWGQMVLRLAFTAASQYFGALACTDQEVEPLLGESETLRLASAISSGISGLRAARQRFFEHRSVDQLVLEIATPVEAILNSTASYWGFVEAANHTLHSEIEIKKVLVAAGLWDWGVLFDRDLRLHFEHRNRWTSILDLSQLSTHVERVLWTIGVVTTPIAEGYWIDVYGDEQWNAVLHILSQ